jgi:hypothetical protein
MILPVKNVNVRPVTDETDGLLLTIISRHALASGSSVDHRSENRMLAHSG